MSQLSHSLAETEYGHHPDLGCDEAFEEAVRREGFQKKNSLAAEFLQEDISQRKASNEASKESEARVHCSNNDNNHHKHT